MQNLLKLEERLWFQISEDVYPYLDIITDYDIALFKCKILVLKKGTSKIWFKFTIDVFDYEKLPKKITKIAEVINERTNDFLNDKLTLLTAPLFYLGVSISDPKEGKAIVNGKEINPKPGDCLSYRGNDIYIWNGDCWYQYETDATSENEIVATAPYLDRAPKPMKCECCGAIMESPYQCDYCGTKYFFN